MLKSNTNDDDDDVATDDLEVNNSFNTSIESFKSILNQQNPLLISHHLYFCLNLHLYLRLNRYLHLLHGIPSHLRTDTR